MTLTDFLLARIEDDEKTARRPTGRVYADDDGCVATPEDEWADGSDRLPNHHNTWALIHDPARVLAECEAKRRIVEREVNAANRMTYRRLLTLVDLASVYADHPDYRDEWRP